MQKLLVTLFALGLLNAAHAQQPASQPSTAQQPSAQRSTTQPAAANDDDDGDDVGESAASPAVSKGNARQQNAARQACRNKVQQQKVRGTDRRDQLQLCLAETHLACVKKAIAQKIGGPQRREFLKNCTG